MEYLNRGYIMKFRKRDYMISYSVFLIFMVLNLMTPFDIGAIFKVLIGAGIPALIVGTITNLLFRNRKN